MELNIAGVVGVGKSSLTKLLEDDGLTVTLSLLLKSK